MTSGARLTRDPENVFRKRAIVSGDILRYMAHKDRLERVDRYLAVKREVLQSRVEGESDEG